MKKLIMPALLILGVFAGDAFSQTKKKIVRRAGGKTIVKKTIVKRTPHKIVRTIPNKIMQKPNSSAVTTVSGLTYIVTQAGTGAQLKAGDNVIINYTGLLTNGVKFDSSLDRNEPFSFPLGAGKVIKGWDEGVQKLRVGDRATLIIPPALGYGARGAGGVIPPDATLIFIVEVMGVQ